MNLKFARLICATIVAVAGIGGCIYSAQFIGDNNTPFGVGFLTLCAVWAINDNKSD